MGICRDGDAGESEDGDGVEGVADVADGEPGFFFGGKRLDLGAVEEARIPINDGYIDGATNGDGRGLASEIGRDPAEANGGEGSDGCGCRDDSAFFTDLADSGGWQDGGNGVWRVRQTGGGRLRLGRLGNERWNEEQRCRGEEEAGD